MRPRISRNEAAYLVQVLESQVAEMEEKLEHITQLEWDFAKNLYDLKHPVQAEYTDTGYFAGHRIVGTEENPTCQISQSAKRRTPKHADGKGAAVELPLNP